MKIGGWIAVAVGLIGIALTIIPALGLIWMALSGLVTNAFFWLVIFVTIFAIGGLIVTDNRGKDVIVSE